MENKKKKRELREKNDTILKMSVLSDTMHLTNEEFGALIRRVMTEDDRENKRYDGMKGFVLNEFKKKEQEWEKSFEQLTGNNKTLISAFSTVFGKADKSHTSFLQFKEQYENNDNNTQGNSKGTGDDKTNTDTGTQAGTEKPTESDLEGEEWEMKTIIIFNENTNQEEKWTIEYQKKNEKNTPNETINNHYPYNDIMKILDAGYEDEWKKYWEDYLQDEE